MMLSEQMRTISVEEQAYRTMQYLARQVVGRPLLYSLVMRDVHRWPEMSRDERLLALSRAARRVGGVCPWVRNKPRVQETLEALAA